MGIDCAGIATMKTGEHVYARFDRLAVFQDIEDHKGIYTHWHDEPITDIEVAIDWCNARLNLLNNHVNDEFVTERLDYYKHWTNEFLKFCTYLLDKDIAELRVLADTGNYYDDLIVFGDTKEVEL